MTTPWTAQWIWGGGEASPRNEWRWFRGTFAVPQSLAGRKNEACLRISADSRYEMYVNGQRAGRGPVRSWPSEQGYDEYRVGHLLRPGEGNTIAVLVMHFGVSTFSYLRGRGGLLVQLDAELGDGVQTVQTLAATDASWRTIPHPGQDRRSGRISCQLPFTERIDARRFDAIWAEADYDDSVWEAASPLGSVGVAPWTKLVPSGIPHLTEEPMQPVRVVSLQEVRPPQFAFYVDSYTLMRPDDGSDHANNLCYAGAFATLVRVTRRTEVRATVQGRGLYSMRLGSEWRRMEELEPVDPPVSVLRAALEPGDHLFWYDAYGPDHGHTHKLAIDADEPISLVSPLDGRTGWEPDGETSPFVAIGPAYVYTLYDFLDQTAEASAWEQAKSAFIERLRGVTAADDLAKLGDLPIRAVPAALCLDQDPFMSAVFKRSVAAYAVPESLQHAVMSGASGAGAVVPVFAGGGDTELMLDFGKEWSGFLQFELTAAAGTVLELYGVEYRDGDWIQHTFSLDNTLRYVCREGYQAYTSPIRRGFRYVIATVRGAERPLELHGVRVLQSNYPVAEIGAFRSSDERLNAIWDISRHTTRLCMEDTFVDCPAFEQAYWVGDSRNEALVNYYVYGATDIVKRCLELVPGSDWQTPLYSDQVPSGWSSVIPNWTFFWIIACREYAEHTGDPAFAQRVLPPVLHTLEHYMQRIDSRGLFDIRGWNLLDWAPIDQPREGVVTHQNAALVRALRDAAALAGLAGEPESGERCLTDADRLAEAINLHLWDERRQAYRDCIHADGRLSETFSMQSQVMAYLCGVAQGERRERLRGYMVSPPESFVQIGSPFMSFFYYEALAESGEFGVMLSDIRRNYGRMIELGATTCWEMYRIEEYGADSNPRMPTRSHCHAWSAGPGYFLGAYVLGVRPQATGWTRVTVEPQPVDLQWAAGAVPLPGGGAIEVEWRADGGIVTELKVTAPQDIELDVRVPGGCRTELIRLQPAPQA